jgi:hypothetical protein
VTDTGGWGAALKALVKVLCDFSNMVLYAWNVTGCWILKEIVYPIVELLLDILQHVVNLIGSGGEILGFLRQINEAILNGDCSQTLVCAELIAPLPDQQLGVLPVTSRCWVDYVPSIDDLSSYACSKSDTCTNADLSFGVTNEDFGGIGESTRQTLCDACPLPTNPSINPYGCDTYTKQCSCSRPQTTSMTCTHNYECETQGIEPVQCALVNDFTTGRSYGNLECRTCPTRPVCHITSGTGVGTCSCLQQGMSLQQCTPSEVYSTKFLNPTTMCAVSAEPNTGKDSNAYVTWKSLATAPCILINAYTARCYRTDIMGYIMVCPPIPTPILFHFIYIDMVHLSRCIFSLHLHRLVAAIYGCIFSLHLHRQVCNI